MVDKVVIQFFPQSHPLAAVILVEVEAILLAVAVLVAVGLLTKVEPLALADKVMLEVMAAQAMLHPIQAAVVVALERQAVILLAVMEVLVVMVLQAA
jgi:hypothetical protein